MWLCFFCACLQLLAEAEGLDDSTIAIDVAIVEVIEQCTALSYQLSQRTCGVNSTVLRNYGVDEKVIAHIANAYRLVFHGQTSVFDAVNQVVDQVPDGPEIQNIVKFIRETKLGIISKL